MGLKRTTHSAGQPAAPRAVAIEACDEAPSDGDPDRFSHVPEARLGDALQAADPSTARGNEADRARHLEAFLREDSAFHQQRSSWLGAHRGEFVAVANGLIVDNDVDEFRLAERIETAFPSTFVLIRRLDDSTEPVERFESPEIPESLGRIGRHWRASERRADRSLR